MSGSCDVRTPSAEEHSSDGEIVRVFVTFCFVESRVVDHAWVTSWDSRGGVGVSTEAVDIFVDSGLADILLPRPSGVSLLRGHEIE